MDIEEIRQCFRERRFSLSRHADQEAGAAQVITVEIQQAGSRAELLAEEDWHSGGVRYLLCGLTDIGRRLHIPIAFDTDGEVIIVSVYERKHKERRRR